LIELHEAAQGEKIGLLSSIVSSKSRVRDRGAGGGISDTGTGVATERIAVIREFKESPLYDRGVLREVFSFLERGMSKEAVYERLALPRVTGAEPHCAAVPPVFDEPTASSSSCEAVLPTAIDETRTGGGRRVRSEEKRRDYDEPSPKRSRNK
jgi:hypothetical protein